ncbi:chorismate mutase [Micromonospora sp. NPDC005174]|uniref:chorismate mutase n=1 Tax=unclassified Micromonospora TaxID=2617518 RepID=UPI0033A366A7
MMTDVVEQNGGPAQPDPTQPSADGGVSGAAPPVETGDPTDARTGTVEPNAAARIVQIRERIDEIDHALITLWQERAALSREVGATRMASGGTRLVLSRERDILERFRLALGADGTQLALLLLRAGRGPL